MKLKKILLLIGVLYSTQNFAQLVINEICPSNSGMFSDEDGDFPDWFEIYNAGSTTVNLFDYSITDDGTIPTKWKFPNVYLAPASHVIIYASDKNRTAYVNHWETAIKENDSWKYLTPAVEPTSNWRLPAFDDAAWSTGIGGFGYGDGDDNTIVTSPAYSVFIRKSFTITDISKISAAVLHIDFDDGYCAYLNGVPIGRSNMPAGNPPYNSIATAGREATMYSAGMPVTKMISPDTLAMALQNGTNVLSIQVHNSDLLSSDLTARAFLSFGITDPSILFSPTPGWFNLTNTLPLHTNFKLSSGETLYLINPSGSVVDFKTIPATKPNHAIGLQPDGSTTWEIFTTPTPGTTNNTGTSYSNYCSDVLTFSSDAGFYNGTQNISISGATEIRYTLDGSDPKSNSTLYTAPIIISSTKVLRAACFSPTSIPIATYTNTYFINEPTTLPVFSISTDPDYFFHPITGIYMLGPNADSVNMPNFGANFWEDWERPVHVEYFEKDRTLKIDQDADVRIFGNWSRANPQKSLAIKAKDKYGIDAFNYKFFPDKNITSFKQLALRNSGSDNNQMQYRDGFIQKSVSKNTNIDIQDYRASIVFINGQYWGIQNTREKINEDYILSNHNVSNVDLVETWGTALAGTNNIWGLSWLAQNLDMADNNNYKIISDSFDLDNMVDYFSTEIFISNWDWPQNNSKYWRPQTGNRKYRFILWDTDISLGLYGLQNVNFNQLDKVVNTPSGPHTEIFSEFLKNISFRNKFVNRYADMMNTHFQTNTLRKLLYDMRDTIAAEIPRHFARWGAWNNWTNVLQETDNFFTARLPIARNEVQAEFSLTKQVNVTLAVSPAGAGYIKINSITPTSLPWTGVYYDGVPVDITALPNPGYTFSHFLSSSLITTPSNNQSFNINVTNANETFTAYFTGSPGTAQLHISEINYNSSIANDAGDWLEIYNYGSVAIDLSSWKLQDKYNHYTIPTYSVLQPNKYVVLCSDTIKFKAAYPMISNFIGPIGFSLSNGGDMVKLTKPNGNTYLTFEYDDVFPWPLPPDGYGYTLESSGPTSDPSAPASWFSGCLGGSPGQAYSPSCTLTSDVLDAKIIPTLYPNPATTHLTIQYHNPSKYSTWKLINAQGLEVKSQSITSGALVEEINLKTINPGLYTIVFMGSDEIYSKKIIIK